MTARDPVQPMQHVLPPPERCIPGLRVWRNALERELPLILCVDGRAAQRRAMLDSIAATMGRVLRILHPRRPYACRTEPPVIESPSPSGCQVKPSAPVVAEISTT
jgi:hypothetical protein